MIIIIMIIVVLFAVLIGWTWNNLYNFNSNTKILYVFAFTIIMLLITFILFLISKSSIQYPNTAMINDVRNVLVLMFTPINGIIIVPFLAKQISKIKENSIDEEQLKKKVIIMAILFIVVLIIECMYLKNIQLGILKMIENMK